MSTKVPLWLSATGFILACSAGCLNVFTLLGPTGHPITHLTGTTSNLALSIVDGKVGSAFFLLFLLLAFFLGAVFSGFIIRNSNIRFGRRYGVSLFFEAFVVVLAWFLFNKNHKVSHVLISFACGLQNALATTYSGTIVRTTHVTGLFTDIGIHLGNVIARTRRTNKKVIIQMFLILGYFCGGLFGGFFYSKLGNFLLLMPISVSLGLAGFHLIFWVKRNSLKNFFHL